MESLTESSTKVSLPTLEPSNFKVSVCICTRNRPEELRKALDSVAQSTSPAYEVIVSDDSTDTATQQLVEQDFPEVIYTPGPRKGLGANRNNALKAVQGTHVLFIDDDVILGKDFLAIAVANLCQQQRDLGVALERLICTGLENNRGELVYPHEQNFLGYQNVDYGQGDEIKTVVINSAIFPVGLFQEVAFDEKLIYGCDEVDFTTRAIDKGYRIVLCPGAINFHFPSQINRDYYEPYRDASRIYVTFKRYLSTEKKTFKAFFYLLLASAYAAARNLKYQGFKSIVGLAKTLQIVISYVGREYFIKSSSL